MIELRFHQFLRFAIVAPNSGNNIIEKVYRIRFFIIQYLIFVLLQIISDIIKLQQLMGETTTQGNATEDLLRAWLVLGWHSISKFVKWFSKQ